MMTVAGDTAGNWPTAVARAADGGVEIYIGLTRQDREHLASGGSLAWTVPHPLGGVVRVSLVDAIEEGPA